MSGIVTIAIARVTPVGGEPFVAASMYARWAMPQRSVNTEWRVGMPDVSVHRISSGLSMCIGDCDPSTHQILAAADLKIAYRTDTVQLHTLAHRESTVFDRMDAIGVECLGPQYPAGRKAEPAHPDMPPDTRNVVTHHTTREDPISAKLQLVYAFASRGFHKHVSVRALNGVDEWGSSDHYRLLVEVG